MDEELTALIVDELGKRHDRKEIIYKVRERTGWNWRQAQQCILFVQTENSKAIAAYQSPRLLLWSICALAVGIGLVAFNLEVLMAFLLRDLLTPVLRLDGSHLRLVESFAGLGITLAGMVGLRKGLYFIFPD